MTDELRQRLIALLEDPDVWQGRDSEGGRECAGCFITAFKGDDVDKAQHFPDCEIVACLKELRAS